MMETKDKQEQKRNQKRKSEVAHRSRNRYNDVSVFLLLDVVQIKGGQYAEYRNKRNMGSALCEAVNG